MRTTGIRLPVGHVARRSHDARYAAKSAAWGLV
jgi:hypothetical protein